MTADRRTFLKLAGAVLLPGAPARWLGAREAVRTGQLGRLVFCRASRATARWLPWVCEGGVPVCERIEREELVLCGTEATLVVDRNGCRRFA